MRRSTGLVVTVTLVLCTGAVGLIRACRPREVAPDHRCARHALLLHRLPDLCAYHDHGGQVS